MTVPYTFANQNGPIPLSQLDADFAAVTNSDNIQYSPPFANSTVETVTAKLAQTVSVKDFGAVGNGIADDTAAIQSAINSANGVTNTIIFPYGTYLITSTLNIQNKNLSLIGLGYQNEAPTIKGNFDGYLIDGSGTSTSNYYGPYYIKGLQLINSNNGSALNSSGCLKLFYTGTSRIENCLIQAQGTCVYLQETISTLFDNCFVIGDSATNPNLYSRGYFGQGRNTRVNNGRVYGCFIGFDIAGDSWVINQNDAEFNYGIIIRTSSLNGLLVEGCHFETSSMIWTNASTLPTTTTTPWTDNGGTGIGWNGGITFLNTHVSIGALGTTNGAEAPMFVCKTQSGFGGAINFIGCDFEVGTPSLVTISQSFNYSTATSIPSGLQTWVSGTVTGFVNPATIPVDNYTVFANFSPSSSNSVGISGIPKLKFNDQSSYIDLSNGTAIHGYTTVSLLSTYLGNQGVQFNNGQFIATTDNSYSLGSSSNRWSVVYAGTGTINTSDVNQKQQFASLTDAEQATAKAIKGLFKTFKFNDAVAKKGDKARIHIGVSAQDVQQAFTSNGLDATKYGLFCSDTWWTDSNGKIYELQTDSSGKPIEGLTEHTQLGVRYEELLAFIIAAW
jgi:hypothetical protein